MKIELMECGRHLILLSGYIGITMPKNDSMGTVYENSVKILFCKGNLGCWKVLGTFQQDVRAC